MSTTAPAAWQAAAMRLAGDLRATGALRSDQVAEAIRSVPRHRFLPDAGSADTPSASLLERSYADRGIMTHTPEDAAGTYSSTSQPSIVAKMLEAAGLRRGMRVLEIGAGTGWHAALIAHITRTQVTTVEHSAVVAAEARSALERVSTPDVTVITGDGYDGDPVGAPYDLIVATCGISGVPPDWLRQLADRGTVLAPVAHGGMHPLMRIRVTSDGPRGRLVTAADFMTAEGALYAAAELSPATAGTPLPAPNPANVQPGAVPNLDPHGAYLDLWMHLAARDQRITCGAAADGRLAGCTLVDGQHAVYIQPDALHPTPGPGGQALADHAVRLIRDWTECGRPPLTAWSCSLTPAGRAQRPVLAPAHWELRRR